MPDYAPQDFGDALRKKFLKETNRIPIGMQNIGGGKQVEKFYTTEEGNVNGIIASLIAENPHARADIMDKIEKNRDVIFKDADTNGDKVLDSGEKENAIINWIKTEYKDSVRPVVYGQPSTIPGLKSRGGTSGFNTKEPVSETNNKNADYDYQGSTPFTTIKGRVELPDFVAISAKNPAIISLTIRKMYKFDTQGRTTMETLANSDTIQADVIGYSPATDMLIVRANANSNILSKDEIVALDASEYDQYLKNTFKIYRESLRGKAPTKKGTTQGTFVTPDAGNTQTGSKRKLY
jgi:hypothetical protein